MGTTTSQEGKANVGRNVDISKPQQQHKTSKEASRQSMKTYVEWINKPLVGVTKNAFSKPKETITIMESQSVIFKGEDPFKVVQVIIDEEGKLMPVIGGFGGNSDNKGQYEQQFNLEGEYKFALPCMLDKPKQEDVLLSIVVKPRSDLMAGVSDEGFSPDKIHIDQGLSVCWNSPKHTTDRNSAKHISEWNSAKHISEVEYDISKACFKRVSETNGIVNTESGSYRHFPRPGLYFFMTESPRRFCVVHVKGSHREFRVDIQDRAFQPMILLIEEGDRVWWAWDKCCKNHCVYEIEAPSKSDPYVPVKDGFRWTTPSKTGLLSHKFVKAGIYFFSDKEDAHCFGTVIVKPKQKEKKVELTEKGFKPDIVYAQTGDRIWWTWDGQTSVSRHQLLANGEINVCLHPKSKKSSDKDSEILEDGLKALCKRVGTATTHLWATGVFHYRLVNSPPVFNTCSVIVNPGPENHIIYLDDNGFMPKEITVHTNDRVWWVWRSGKTVHNIVEVSQQGSRIRGGLSSGAPRTAPSAFVHQFYDIGVFYFCSDGLTEIFEATVISALPKVHTVHVGSYINPDPVTVKVNDIVCWVFRDVRMYDVYSEHVKQVKENGDLTVPPRRCMSKAIMQTGVQRFYSGSFTNGKKEEENSTVICHKRFMVRVDQEGFRPSVYCIERGNSIIWSWIGTNEEHNIVHVKSPDSDGPLNVNHVSTFSSGKPLANSSFLYTFNKDGSYTVASQGAPEFFCTIVVKDIVMRVKEPYLEGMANRGTLVRGNKLKLVCDTPGASIFYTVGSSAELDVDSIELYKPEIGVVMSKAGHQFVRAMAVKDGRLNSDIFTSNPFRVLEDQNDNNRDTTDSAPQEVQNMGHVLYQNSANTAGGVCDSRKNGRWRKAKVGSINGQGEV